MRPHLVTLAGTVHALYAPSCACDPQQENGADDLLKYVRCARETLLHRAETLINRLCEMGYNNKDAAREAHSHPSITSRAHAGG